MSTNGTAPINPGDLVADRYRVEAVIGTGGMATVYRAVDEQLGRVVALKIFRTDVVDAASVSRQTEEIRLLAGLDHPALVTLYDAVPAVSNDPTSRGVLVMQYIEGADLRHRLASEGPLTSAAAAAIGADMASALAYVHTAGVIHRDISPANILLPAVHGGGLPLARLADFGIARLVDSAGLTTTGSIIGTATYLSPEQAMGAQLTPASDIYSLGLVLLESLTGERSFPGTAVESAVARVSADPVIPDDLSPAWQSLLRSMTQRDPAERPAATAVERRLRSLPSSDGATRVMPAAMVATEVMPAAMAATEAMPAAMAATEAMPAAMAATEAMPAAMAATGAMPPAALAATTRLGAVDPTFSTEQTFSTEKLDSVDRTVPPQRSKRAVVVLAVLAAALLAIVLVVAVSGLGGGGSTPAAPVDTPVAEAPAAETPVTETPVVEEPQPPAAPEYPVIDGPLGDSLEVLEASVADSTIPEDLRGSLQDAVLSISTAAAATDFEGARDQLDALVDSVDDNEDLTGRQSEAILDAADRVDRELEASAKAADKDNKPGNGNGNGNGKNER